MSVVGISMVKDEVDVIEQTVQWMLHQCDAVIVADNMSSDGTRDVLDKLASNNDGTMVVVDDYEVGYYQSAKMSGLARIALRQFDARWVVPFDADELWMPALNANKASMARIADTLMALPANEVIATAELYDHVCTSDDKPNVHPFLAMQYRRKNPGPLPKVAAVATAPVRIAMGNHGASYGDTTPSPVLHIRHFPLRSAEHMIRKARNGAEAYAATNLDEQFGAHWRDWGKLTDEQLREAFFTYYFVQNPRRQSDYRRDPVYF